MRKINFLVPEELKNSAGIYKIQKDMFIYIGQTKNFSDRFGRHRTNKGQTYKLMKSGGKFEILELIDDEKERLKKETEYIKYFSSSSDYICLNKAENVNYKIKRKFKNKNIRRKFSKIKFPVVFENEVIEFLKEKGISYERI